MTQKAVRLLEEVRQMSREDREWIAEQLYADAHEHSAVDALVGDRKNVDSVLKERLDGPFEPFSDNWKDDVRDRAADMLREDRDES
jgi:hypothetical protein